MSDQQKHDDGGQAFPVPLTLRVDGNPMTAGELMDGGNGMTLCDYFAAKALTGIMACNYAIDHLNGQADVATLAYNIADAMIAERKRRMTQ